MAEIQWATSILAGLMERLFPPKRHPAARIRVVNHIPNSGDDLEGQRNTPSTSAQDVEESSPEKELTCCFGEFSITIVVLVGV